MRVYPALAALAAGAALTAGLAACGTAAPSAQCRSQLHQVAALQADANATQDGSVATANGSLGRFNHDVDASGHLLKVMKSEGCPEGGY